MHPLLPSYQDGPINNYIHSKQNIANICYTLYVNRFKVNDEIFMLLIFLN